MVIGAQADCYVSAVRDFSLFFYVYYVAGLSYVHMTVLVRAYAVIIECVCQHSCLHVSFSFCTARSNMTEIRQRWLPLIKGEADFFTCWLQHNASLDKFDLCCRLVHATVPTQQPAPLLRSYLHDIHDCTNESPTLCDKMDTVLTLSLMRRYGRGPWSAHVMSPTEI